MKRQIVNVCETVEDVLNVLQNNAATLVIDGTGISKLQVVRIKESDNITPEYFDLSEDLASKTKPDFWLEEFARALKIKIHLT